MKQYLSLLAVCCVGACASTSADPEVLSVDPALVAAQAQAEAENAADARAEAEAALRECKAVDLLDDVGKPSAEVALELPTGSRVIEPSSIVTQDYRPQRINVTLDADGNVARVWCG